MIHFTQGNLLDADVQALVNTVNTVGVMGKGIALMFKERFPENLSAYAAACKAGKVHPGRMFVFQNPALIGPRWIINFPTKKHWRNPSRLEWIEQGLDDLRRVIAEQGIRSIAVPPLGCGSGGLDWNIVRPRIEQALADLEQVEVVVYEPTATYQNTPKRTGVEALTPARALIAEMIRRYGVLGFDCTLIEIQKLAWFLDRFIRKLNLPDELKLNFQANRYGPFDARIHKLLDALDGSFLHSDKRIADAHPTDVVWFEHRRRESVAAYFQADAAPFAPAVEATDQLIDGFQSPLGLEVLATVDWLLLREGAEPGLEGIRQGLQNWPGGAGSAERKLRVFPDRLIELALQRLTNSPLAS